MTCKTVQHLLVDYLHKLTGVCLPIQVHLGKETQPFPLLSTILNNIALCFDDIIIYPKVTIICRYIFLQFQFKTCFASTKFCDLYVEMVQG